MTQEKRRLGLVGTATLILLAVAFAYLVMPWDVLPFTFFDDLALVMTVLVIWGIVTFTMHLPIRKMLVYGATVVLIFSALFGAWYASSSWAIVNVGEAMLIVNARTGEISDPIRGATAGFYLDGLERMLGLQYPVKIYYQVDTVGMWSEWKLENNVWIETARGDFPAVKTLSKDGLEIEVDIQVRWSLNITNLKALYQKYPSQNWKELTIASIIREEVRDIISTYSAIQVIENRSSIANALEDAIKNGLIAEPTLVNVIMATDLVVDLRDLDPSIEFVKAVEAKLAEEQRKIQAEFEYERLITLAKAEADSKVIVANGTSEAISKILTITGTANATRIAELYLYLEALKVIAPSAKQFIIIMGDNNALPIVYPIPTNSTG